MAATTRPQPTEAEQYARVINRIERAVAAINTALGLSTEFDEHFNRTCVTFGYIGNCGSQRPDGTYANDDRRWMVFLPHPGRVGTDEDRIGGFRTGDPLGAQVTLTQLLGFLRGITWKRPA